MPASTPHMTGRTTFTRGEREAARAARERSEAEAMRRVLEAAAAQRLARAHIPARYAHPASAGGAPKVLDDLLASPGLFCLVCGNVGVGKTDLACAVALEAVGRGMTARFTGDADMLSEIRSAYDRRGDTESDALSGFTRPDVLVIDDLGKLRPTQWGLEKMWQVINARYSGGKATLATSNLSPSGLSLLFSQVDQAETTKPLVSRLTSGLVLTMRGADRRKADG